jgi:predicted metalloprotease with PDZ domain
VFRLDDQVMGTPGMAALISDATAVDGAGQLPLVRRLEEGVLTLTASRAAVGTVTLTYRARSIPVTEAGDRFGLRHDATGIGGLGAFFLVLPEAPAVDRIRVGWAPSSCPTGGEGMTSFTADATGGLGALWSAAYFFGHPRVVTVGAIRTAWFGAPALDVEAAAEWAAKAFAVERAFFADDDPGTYSVFVRMLPTLEARSNGVGHRLSFLAAIGPQTTFGPRLRTNIAHEMLHRWLGLHLRLAGPDGTHFWFTEGFTVHLANVLMHRAGLISSDEFLAELNVAATKHFTNPRAGASNDEIRRGFNSDQALSVVPYTRGALYAAELDAGIRRASQGKRSLDDMLRGLYGEISDPEGLPVDRFRETVRRELGAEGVARFDAVILRGGTPAPPADAYGPCFTQAARTDGAKGFQWVRVTGVPDARCAAW